MKKCVPVAEARTNFGALPEKAQRGPVAISKKGRPVAVSMPADEFEDRRRFTLEQLRREVRAGLEDLEAGEVVDGAEAFEAVRREEHDVASGSERNQA